MFLIMLYCVATGLSWELFSDRLEKASLYKDYQGIRHKCTFVAVWFTTTAFAWLPDLAGFPGREEREREERERKRKKKEREKKKKQFVM